MRVYFRILRAVVWVNGLDGIVTVFESFGYQFYYVEIQYQIGYPL